MRVLDVVLKSSVRFVPLLISLENRQKVQARVLDNWRKELQEHAEAHQLDRKLSLKKKVHAITTERTQLKIQVSHFLNRK